MKNKKLLKLLATLSLGGVMAVSVIGVAACDKDSGSAEPVKKVSAVDGVLATSNDETDKAIYPHYTGPAAALSSEPQSAVYELNAKDLPTGALEEAYDSGIFSIPKGSTIRNRDAYPELGNKTPIPEFTRSVQNGVITVNVPSSGKLKFSFSNGSGTAGKTKYTITGPDSTEIKKDIELPVADKVLVEVEINVVQGAYTFKTGAGGGTIDLYAIKLTLDPVTPKPIESLQVVNAGTTDYLITQKVDCTGVKLVAKDGNNVTHDVDLSNCEFDVSNYNPNVSGEYTISVTFHIAGNLESNTKDFTATYTVKVYAVDSIKLDLVGLDGSGKQQVAAQQTYLVGDTYVKENNISVIATCDYNGSKIEYKLKKDWYSLTDSVDLSTARKSDVTVSVNTAYTVGGKEVNASYEIVAADKKDVVDNKVTVTVGEHGLFSTVTQAVQYFKKCAYAATVDKVIEIEAGTYAEKIWIDVPNVTLVGKGATADDTTITCSLVEGDADNLSGSLWGLNCATVHVTGANFKAYNVAIRNDFDYLKNKDNYSGNQAAQGLALTLDADGAVLYNCHLYGNQDTLYMKSGRSYYYKSQIDGNVDFIFGNNTGLAFFEECKIVAVNRNSSNNGYVTAAKHEAGNKPDYGYIFYKCELTDDGKVQNGSMALGRPWGAKATVAYIECSFSKAYSKTSRWASMSGAEPADADFCEYGSTGDGAVSAPVAGGKVLTAEQAANYTKANIFGTSNGKVGYTTAFDCDAALHTLQVLAGFDFVNPEVKITTATTATAGDVITIAYTASDDKTAVGDLTVTVTVTKNGSAVTVTDNKFTAEEGVYTVTVTVRDAAGNEATDSIQITVSAKVDNTGSGNEGNGGGSGDNPAVPPETPKKKGCGSTSTGDITFIGGASAMGIIALFAVSRVLRKKKEN